MRSYKTVFFFLGILLLGLLQPELKAQQELPALDTEAAISMDLQDAPLKDVLKIFSIQSGLNFIADETVAERKVTLYLDRVPIKDAMNRLFKANNLSYEFDESANIFTVKYWGEPEAEMVTKIYRLKHRSVTNSTLEKEKQSLFASKGFSSNAATSTATSTTAAANTQNASGGIDIVSAIKQVLSKNGKISEDNRTNSLIITDMPSRFASIEGVIATLDIPQPQVLLEVEILDVNKNIVDKMGFNIGTTSAPNPFTLTFKGALTDGTKMLIGDPANFGTSGYLSLGKTYNLMLDYLRQQTDTKFLARPRIITMNNETAEIGITKDEIVNTKTETTTPEGGGPSTQTVTYDRATSLTLTPEGIGVFLRVTPQINIETGEVTLVVNPKTSSTTQSSQITTEGQVALDPEVRSAKSIVKVKDGETVVLGGLIHKEKIETVKKLPILSDIPIAGALFRHKYVEKNQDRELLVFITTHILKEQKSRFALNTREGSGYAQQPDQRSTQRSDVDSYMNVFDRRRTR